VSTLLAVSAYQLGRSIGTSLLVLLLVALVWRTLSSRRSRRARVTDGVAAAVVAALLVAGATRPSPVDDLPDAWSSPAAAELRAGFIAGCEQTAPAQLDCGCVFSSLSSVPPYDTPRGFATLQDVLAGAERDPAALPGPVVAAVRTCSNA
jgi:hypothetical protein